MNIYVICLARVITALMLSACSIIGIAKELAVVEPQINIDQLRAVYSQAPSKWPAPHVHESVEYIELGLLPKVSFPEHNPFSEPKARLGRILFNDGNLSRSKQIACASCHDPDLGWADGRKASFGHNRQKGNRNAPTIENSGYLSNMFWDGRVSSLEQQALHPIINPIEMGFTMDEAIKRLRNIDSYANHFKDVFGDSAITAPRIAKALATFQRTIVSRRSDFDAFLLSRNETDLARKKRYNEQMSNQAIHGLHLFRTKAQCGNCHHGPNFTDQKFHNLGLTFYQREREDLGRYKASNNPADVGKFKTPSLRGVFNTKPWMHNGIFPNMQGIINIYNAGGFVFSKQANDPLSPVTSELLSPLKLSREEQKALIAFLESITAPPARSRY